MSAGRIEPWRFERKFTLPEDRGGSWLAGFLAHPMGYRQAYPPRVVNSLYLEALDFRCAAQHLGGLAQRHKVRLRWYGALKSAARGPQLEVKQKKGQLGRKLIFPLGDLAFGAGFGMQRIQRLLGRAGLPAEILEEAKGLTVPVFNRYLRHYYVDRSGQLRVTLDTRLQYEGPLGANWRPRDMPAAMSRAGVLELKYGADREEQAKGALEGLLLRLTQNSKFLNGLQACFA